MTATAERGVVRLPILLAASLVAATCAAPATPPGAECAEGRATPGPDPVAAAPQEPVVRLYDVRDLAAAEAGGDDAVAEEEAVEEIAARLRTFVTFVVGGTGEPPYASVDAKGATLVVRGAPAVHLRVDRHLRRLREGDPNPGF